MLIDRNQITALHWQLKVDREATPDGHIVTALDDLEAEIKQLILTPLGSVPLNPEKGCDIYPYIDRPPAVAIPNMTRAIWDALTRWCVRIVVTDVQVEALDVHHWKMPVFWRPLESVLSDIRRTVVEI